MSDDKQILLDIAEDQKKLNEEIKELDSQEKIIKDKLSQMSRKRKRLAIEETIAIERIKRYM